MTQLFFYAPVHSAFVMRKSAAAGIAAVVLAGCGATAPHHAPPVVTKTVTTTAPGPDSADGGQCAAADCPGSDSNGSAQGLGNGPGYPVGGPTATITSRGGCTLTEQGDPSVGNRYYNVSTTLIISAPGEITINSADIQVLGADGSEIGSLQVMPVGASSTISQPLVVTSGTVPFTGVADQYALSGQFGPSCRVVSVAYDDGNTAP